MYPDCIQLQWLQWYLWWYKNKDKVPPQMQKVKALLHTYRLEFSVIFINLRARLCNKLGTHFSLLGENRNNSKVVQNCYLRKKIQNGLYGAAIILRREKTHTLTFTDSIVEVTVTILIVVVSNSTFVSNFTFLFILFCISHMLYWTWSNFIIREFLK